MDMFGNCCFRPERELPCLRRKLFPALRRAPVIRFLYPVTSKAAHSFHSQPRAALPAILLVEKLQAAWSVFEEQVVRLVIPLGEDSSIDCRKEITEQKSPPWSPRRWLFPLMAEEDAGIFTAAVTQLCMLHPAAEAPCAFQTIPEWKAEFQLVSLAVIDGSLRPLQ